MRLSHPWHTSWHMSRVTRDGGDHWCPRSVSSNPSPGQIYATVYNEQLVTGNIHTDRDGASTVPTIKYNPVTWNLIVDTYTGSCLLISICFTAVTLFYFIYLQIFWSDTFPVFDIKWSLYFILSRSDSNHQSALTSQYNNTPSLYGTVAQAKTSL